MVFSEFNKKDGGSRATLIRTLKLTILVLITPALLLAVGCNDSSSSGGDTGTLSVYMSDSVTNDFEAVYVTIDEVAVHIAEDEDQDTGNQADENTEQKGGWKIVANPKKTYNLLELINGVMAELGTEDLETGHYTQVRLLLGKAADEDLNINGNTHPYPNYVVKEDGSEEELKVPSGYQTGIKLVHGFDIVAGRTAELLLDFDANRSVVATGGSKYILKPTIKVMDSLDYPLVQGAVMDESGEPLAGAVVSAQRVDSEGGAEALTSTLSDDETGGYQMYLPEGTYYIVAYKGDVVDEEGADAAYGPACIIVEDLQLDRVYGGNDFNLALSKTGDIVANVSLPDGAEDDEVETATLSVRTESFCSEEEDGSEIEVLSETAGQSGSYTFSVPGSGEGILYSITAEFGDEIIEEEVTIAGETSTSVEFDFR